MTAGEPDLAALEFALGPDAHLPWTVQRLPRIQRITNARAVVIAECFEDPERAVIADFIVAAVNRLVTP